ncbi:MAG: hypothetical protein AcusKO_17200 [Acuticoccus sp.]
MKRIYLAAILASTALIPAAYAQVNNDMTKISDADVCAELVTYVDDNDTDATGITADRAATIAAGDDPKMCRDAYQMAMGGNDTEAEATAGIKVAVPDPEVNVEQRAPQVSVAQPQPDVNVTPGRPIVTVNQAEPVVRVVTTPPKVTIDMPKPEILVEIPDPTVDVAMAEPRVTVEQPQPVVSVTQGEVKLEVGDKSVEPSQGEAQVDVTQSNPTVTIDKAEGSNIEVAEVSPEVRYTAAKPRIEVSEEGEPAIAFNQPGDANVRVRRMSADETRAAAAERSGQAETAAAETAAPAEREMAAADTGELTAPADTPRSVVAGNLIDASVMGANGDTIGDVEAFATRGGETYLVVGVGGLLGLGEKQIAIPLNEATFRDEAFHVPSLTDEAAEEMAEYDDGTFTPVEEDQNIDVVMN